MGSKRIMTRDVLIGALLMVVGVAAQAAPIEYVLTHLGGSRWQYQFTVSNNGSSPIRWFSLTFDPALYDDTGLVPASPASITGSWDEVILPSGPGFAANYDAYTSGSGIPVGGALSGFTVQVIWLGSGTPGAVPFEIIDTDTRIAQGTGTARLADNNGRLEPFGTAIPTLDDWALLALLLALGALGTRATARCNLSRRTTGL